MTRARLMSFRAQKMTIVMIYYDFKLNALKNKQ